MKKNQKIYGIHSVNEFLKVTPHRVLNIWIQESKKSESINIIYEAAKYNEIPVALITKDQLDKMTDNKNHQGVAIEIKKEKQNSNNLTQILSDNKSIKSIYLILDSIQDPHNLGACIRTAVAAGVSAIILPKNRSATVNETVKKVACGAVENITIVTVVNLVRAIKEMKEMGIWVIGATRNTKESIYDIDMQNSVAFVIGNEGKGIRPLVEKECDYVASLPMTPKIESLNVSVATGIILFEAVRQRSQK
ncbi:MAG: 23S rRNA (guanosine(2251)-2'-O)-methyltransferase RlmB [Legionellales bacterium]|nr:23S rRNA (guanosine(2251)-2'-O)-methyltransferase RlmB [Legionellales bacterium]